MKVDGTKCSCGTRARVMNFYYHAACMEWDAVPTCLSECYLRLIRMDGNDHIHNSYYLPIIIPGEDPAADDCVALFLESFPYPHSTKGDMR